MEALIGFAVGYWVGTRHGREGLGRALGTAREIWESPETRRALGEGLSALQGLTPVAEAMKKQRDARGAIISGVIDEIMARRNARQAA
ncbi:hypothetical protein [Trebonia sp.]|uniref:hypothetical protein n=1 Tax=Trebonia sp. TaxID=2767075 RepID=UPI0026164637|nr:hypothetical protein [Trebonia sp.]